MVGDIMTPESLLSIAAGLALAAAAGFRVFVPLLVVSVAARSGWLEITPAFEWVATTQALIVLRAMQGAGAALMVPQVFSLIQRTFTGPARAEALSMWAASLALGGLVGQVLGGVLVSADLLGTGWRPVFLVNVPIGVVLLIASFRFLPVDRPAPARPLDLGGLVSLSAAVLLLIVPLVLGHEQGWPAWTFGSLALSVVAIIVFAVIERSVERGGGAPLISERVLRAPGMPAALIAIVLALAAYGGFLFTFTQHLQGGLHGDRVGGD